MIPGIFSAMSSYPDAADVLAELGDKVIEGFLRAVQDARSDLARYREGFPDFVAQASERGLANWIHDRLWYRLGVRLSGLPEVQFADREPHREMRVGTRYLFRVKRHSVLGALSTYPTQTALDFLQQVPMQWALDGLDEVRLVMGYVWDADTRSVGPAVISLRADRDTVLWMEELTDAATGSPESSGGSVTPLLPRSEPTKPTIEVQVEDEPELGEDDF